MTETAESRIKVSRDNGVTTVTLNQPERRNSLSMAMLETLSEVLALLATDADTRMVALSRNVSRKHAMEMLLTGEMISASRAEEIGLVNRVVDEQVLDDTVYRLARTIADKSSHTLRIGKEAFYRQLDMPLAEAYDYTAKVMADNLQADDAQEGICAFLDKRTPEWKDR